VQRRKHYEGKRNVAKSLVKKAKRLFRQVKEGSGYYAAEQRRKKKAKKRRPKKDWASKYNIGTRSVIKQLRESGVSDTEIKKLLGK